MSRSLLPTCDSGGEDNTHESTEAPQLSLNELFTPAMSFNGVTGFLHDPVTPKTPNGSSPPASSHTPRSTMNDNKTPTKQMASISRIGSPLHSEANVSSLSAGMLSAPETPASESNDPWSSAVGRATTGKSGRVIERLMGDNDRLQKEIKLATVRLEEEVKRGESATAALDSLRATNENLKAIHETGRAALSRKERKIEELKADVQAERARREQAEKEMKIIGLERDEIVGSCRRELHEEKERARKSTSQYEILSSSWKSLAASYNRQIQKLKMDVKALFDARTEDQQRLARLDVVVGQLHQECEKTRRINDKMAQEFEQYKREKEESIRNIRERAERNASAHEEVSKEMAKVLGEMKYVINVKRDVKGAE